MDAHGVGTSARGEPAQALQKDVENTVLGLTSPTLRALQTGYSNSCCAGEEARFANPTSEKSLNAACRARRADKALVAVKVLAAVKAMVGEVLVVKARAAAVKVVVGVQLGCALQKAAGNTLLGVVVPRGMRCVQRERQESRKVDFG